MMLVLWASFLNTSTLRGMRRRTRGRLRAAQPPAPLNETTSRCDAPAVTRSIENASKDRGAMTKVTAARATGWPAGGNDEAVPR